MAEPKKPFWRTLPGVLTEIAGVVTAFGAMAGVLTSTGVIGGGDDKSTARAQLAGSVSTEKSQPLQEWVDKANTICERAIESYQALPDKATIPVMASQVDIGWRKVERLRGLTPPGTERPTHKKFVKSIAAQMEAIERRYLLTRNYQSYSRAEFRRQYAVLRKKIGDENERGDALAVQLGATVCAQEPY